MPSKQNMYVVCLSTGLGFKPFRYVFDNICLIDTFYIDQLLALGGSFLIIH